MVKMPHWPIYLGPDRNIVGSVGRMKKMLSILGNPHLKLRNIIHITGTKGKGSTAVNIDAILRESGFNTNLYTSPHIYECNERFLINGVKISDNDLYFYTEIIRSAAEKTDIESLSSFEVMTLTAFLKFADTSADFNIIEVGMGGMTDATNVFDENPPFICVFCPIHLDHKIFLGETSLAVAYQKLGILKFGAKYVVIGQQSSDVKEYILENLKKLNINDYYFYSRDFESFKTGNDDEFLFESRLGHFLLKNPILLGDYQIKNLSTSILVCLLCNPVISESTINNGVKKVVHCTRMEEISNSWIKTILPIGSKFFVDGGHNKIAAVAILQFIKDYMAKNQNIKAVYIIIARSKNSDNLDMLSIFNDKIIKKIYTIRALEARPEPPEKIKLDGELIGLDLEISQDIHECLKKIGESEKDPCLIIACGSLYLGRFFSK